jgi:DNA-binding response OmpR family regulator
MSGLEVMRKLRERTGIPIILLTAKDNDADSAARPGAGRG